MDKANRTRVPKLMLVGAISFGRPDTLLHAFRGLQVQFVGRANHNGGDAFDAVRLICRYQMGRHRRSPPAADWSSHARRCLAARGSVHSRGAGPYRDRQPSVVIDRSRVSLYLNHAVGTCIPDKYCP